MCYVLNRVGYLCLLVCLSCIAGSLPCESKRAVRVSPRIISSFHHDPEAFTQGLEYRDGRLYESTGLYGKSSLRVLDTTGKVLKNTYVPGIFAEGCTILGKCLYQLTWKETQCLIYSFPELEIKRVRTYQGEGWGLTNDTKNIIMSNGSDTIYYRDTTFAITKKIPVKNSGLPLKNLNELEYARNHLFANVWFDNCIYEIVPLTGDVVRIIDCNAIVQQEKLESDQNVLNGIAYLATSDRFFITGKNWKHIYLVNIPRSQNPPQGDFRNPD
jgi:glutaminyl-peptide cyclotransferase